jgi:4-nitrophenyl phosphatase
MIDSLSPRIKGIILDMDGVLWRGSTALMDLPAFFERIKQRALRVVLATNNATRDPEQSLKTMQSFGVNLELSQIVTSGMAVTYLLKKRFPNGGPVYIVGEIGLENALRDGGFYLSEKDPLAVVAGLDRTVTYDKIRIACLLIRGGAPFYGTNPDSTYPAPEGLIPGAGTILAAIQTASGVNPIVAGKPMPGMFQFSLERLGTMPEETLVVGDRLDTDIAGGQRVGCKTALVLSGVTTPDQLSVWSPKPDLIAARADELI